MPKKTEKIELRIEAEYKKAFENYTQQLGVSVSGLLRDYIKQCINSEKGEKKDE